MLWPTEVHQVRNARVHSLLSNEDSSVNGGFEFLAQCDHRWCKQGRDDVPLQIRRPASVDRDLNGEGTMLLPPVAEWTAAGFLGEISSPVRPRDGQAHPDGSHPWLLLRGNSSH